MSFQLMEKMEEINKLSTQLRQEKGMLVEGSCDWWILDAKKQSDAQIEELKTKVNNINYNKKDFSKKSQVWIVFWFVSYWRWL